MGDYYTEDIPIVEGEEEVLELLPVHDNTPMNIDVEDEGEEDPDDLVIVENASELQLRAKSHIQELENTLKNKLIYGSGSSVLVHGGDEEETTFRNRMFRFKMLENEFRSLKLEIEADTKSKDNLMKKSIDKTMMEIEEFQKNDDHNKWVDYWDQRLKDLNIHSKQSIKVPDVNKTEETDAIERSIANFDSRIGKLETQFANISSTSSSMSLQDTIDDLYRRTNLILDNGSSIDEIQFKITKLLNDCEEVAKGSRHKTPISLTDQKLLVIYERLKKMPQFEHIIPLIVQRLKSINGIVMRASTTVDFMNDLESQFIKIETQVDNWNNKLDRLEKQLELNEINFEKTKALFLKQK